MLTAALALFAAYISLVPFDFRPLSPAAVADGLIKALDLRALSPANFIANVVLFIPFAFFAAATLFRGRVPLSGPRQSLPLPQR